MQNSTLGKMREKKQGKTKWGKTTGEDAKKPETEDGAEVGDPVYT